MHQWGFEPYVTHMDYGQRFLSEYGEPVTEGRNISKLLRGIQGTIMSHTKCSVVADYTTMESFTLATDYLYRFIESWSVWGISDLITNDKFGKVGGGKGGGKFNGRGSCIGVGECRGRGRGRGGCINGYYSTVHGGGICGCGKEGINCYYTYEYWYIIIPEDKSECCTFNDKNTHINNL